MGTTETLEQRIYRRAREWQRANCNHTAVSARTGPYFGGVATRADRMNPAAHGGVCIRETCKCGMTRAVLVNGRHTEASDWEVAV